MLLVTNYAKNYASKIYQSLRPIGHFKVMDGSEAKGDLVLIQTFLLYYVNQVIVMLTNAH